MVTLLDSAILRAATDLPDPRDMTDRILNEITSYLMRNRAAPKYLYINERTWAMCMGGVIDWVDGMEIEVIDTKYQHPRCAFVKGKRYSYREIAEESHRLMADEDESIERGLLQIL